MVIFHVTEASTTTESSATETADKTIITSAVPPLATVSPPAQGTQICLKTTNQHVIKLKTF